MQINEISNEEEKTFAPDFWNNAKEAEVIVKNLRNKKKWIEDYNKAIELTDELHLLMNFIRKENSLQRSLQHQATENHIVEFKNMLSDEGDTLSAVLQITAGAGGTESCDWLCLCVCI
jgi:peptide chain release factor 2